LQVVDHALGQPAQHHVEHAVDQGFLAAEILVDGLQRDIGRAGHIDEADLMEVLRGKELQHGLFKARQCAGPHGAGIELRYDGRGGATLGR
jgi:hypothetical protein